jgi:hypothetical protein
MSEEAQENIAYAILILAACFGLSHCSKVEAQVELIKAQTKQIEAQKQ